MFSTKIILRNVKNTLSRTPRATHTKRFKNNNNNNNLNSNNIINNNTSYNHNNYKIINNNKKVLKVGVVGLGPGGQATSLFLAQTGHKIQVFERVPDPKPVGAGFMLQPTAFVALKKLGLLEKFVNQGSIVDRLDGRNFRGRPVIDLNYRELNPNLFALGLFRGAVYQMLLDDMNNKHNNSIDITCGCNIVKYQQEPGGLVSLVDADGKSHGPFDLVVVSDGARSALRQSNHQNYVKRDFVYKWGTLWCIVEDDTEFYHNTKTLTQLFKGTEKMMGNKNKKKESNEKKRNKQE